MNIESIETARLRIRQFDCGDLGNCIRFRREVFGVEQPDAAASPWLKWTIDSYRELGELGQPPYADYAVVMKDSGEFIGSAGIVPTVVPWGALKGNATDRLLSPEIGLFWGVLPEFRRRGFASEAAGALLDYLFNELGARHVVATTEHDNIASRRTMEKLGMKLWRNPHEQPRWCQVVGFVANPRAGSACGHLGSGEFQGFMNCIGKVLYFGYC